MKYLVTIFAILLFAKTPTISGAQASGETQSKMTSPYKQLETAASQARLEEPESISNLTDAVIGSPHFFQLPDPLITALKIELTKAENGYRRNENRGVSEAQLADLLNLVGKRLKVPDYARTTPHQVRALRMNLAIASPRFMGIGLSRQGMKIGESIETTLSPLQAAHLFCVMIDQKLTNEDFQDPSIDLSKRSRERNQDLEVMKRRGQASGDALVMHRHNPKNAEMRAAIATGIESMSIQDSLELLDNMFTSIKLK
jgi:hypothetical protein